MKAKKTKPALVEKLRSFYTRKTATKKTKLNKRKTKKWSKTYDSK